MTGPLRRLSDFHSPGAPPSHGGPATTWPTLPEPAGGANPPWERYFAALFRYAWLIAAITITGGSLGVVIARHVVPQYEVYATIWLNSETPQARTAGPIRAERLLSTTSWPELLGSFAILDSVAIRSHLYVLPSTGTPAALFDDFKVRRQFLPGSYELRIGNGGAKYTLLNEARAVVDEGVVGDSIGRSAGFQWQPSPATLPPGAIVRFALTTPREAAVELRNHLNVTLARESSLLRIVLKGTDPRRTAATLTTLVEEFEATAARLKTRNLVEFATTLDQQLAYAAQQLRDAEIALESFRVRTITLPSEGGTVAAGLEITRDPVMRHFFDEKLQLDSVRNDRESILRTMEAVGSGQLSTSALLAIPSVHASTDLAAAIAEHSSKEAALRTAQQLYTEEHPKVVELRTSIRRLERETVPQMVSGVVERLRHREQDLSERVAGASRELRQIPTRTIEEMRLRRNVDTRLALYTTLKSRYEEARLAQASALPDMSVLDYPVVPQSPSRNLRTKLIAGALVASLVAGVMLALLLDLVDRRFRYPEQATNELGLEIVGVVPRINSSRSEKSRTERAWQLTESFRSLRMALNHANGSGPILVTVSSPGSGDGKSFVSANLALSFVNTGTRTLLIDGDVRRGALHSVFELSGQPGLTDHLDGKVALADVLHSTANGLTILPSGTRGKRAPELLASKRMMEAMAELRTRFDVIVVDSAPLSAGIDAFVLATQTTNLLVVLRSGETDRKLADAKLRIVDRLPIRVIGAVLNAVKPTGSYRYYAYNYAYDDRGLGAGPPHLGQPIADPLTRS